MGESTLVPDPPAAVEWYRKAVAITRELQKSDPGGVETRRWSAERHQGLGNAPDRAGEGQNALTELQRSAEIWHTLSQAEPLRLDLQHSELAAQCQPALRSGAAPQ